MKSSSATYLLIPTGSIIKLGRGKQICDVRYTFFTLRYQTINICGHSSCMLWYVLETLINNSYFLIFSPILQLVLDWPVHRLKLEGFDRGWKGREETEREPGHRIVSDQTPGPQSSIRHPHRGAPNHPLRYLSFFLFILIWISLWFKLN